MKKYYIYLTIVHHPILGDLYYAGKKKSEGSEKDDKYHGSCLYRWWKVWLKEHPEWFKTRILQWFETTEEQAKAETDLILKCLYKHGAFLYGTHTDKDHYRSWLDQFGKGFCLNGHWNSMNQCWIAGHTDEAIRKGLQTRRDDGSFQRFQQAGVKASHQPEALIKAQKSREEHGGMQKATKAAHTSEAIAKNVATHRANDSYIHDPFWLHNSDVTTKMLVTQKANGQFEKFQKLGCDAAIVHYKYFYNDVLVYVGTARGASTWQKKLNQIWVKGESCEDYICPSTNMMFFINGDEVVKYSALNARIIAGKTKWSEWSLADFDKNFIKVSENKQD